MERKIATDTFDRIAPGWYNFRHWSIFRNELETLEQRWRSGRLLNLGCAHGPDFLPFAEGFDLHGVDFSGEMLRQGQKYARKFSFSPYLVRADVTRLPFAAETFDWALSVATYHHLRQDGAAIALGELRRVLKPGGRMAVSDVVATAEMPDDVKADLALYSACVSGAAFIDDLTKMMSEAGFEQIRIKPKDESREFIREWAEGRNLEDYVVSATIEAVKPSA